MSALTSKSYSRDHLHQVLWCRAETRCYLIRECAVDDPVGYFNDFAIDIGNQVRRHLIDHHQAIDALYETALHSGMVADLGDDAVQTILSSAFRQPRHRQRAAA